MPSLLDDFLSGDTSRVMHATWETIASRDPGTLAPLVAALPRIRQATDDLDLGGAIYSNGRNLEHAFAKLVNSRNGLCWCADYPGLLMYDPAEEEHADHVRILSTSEPGWSMSYVCECSVCGLVFDVEQGDHHVTWWRWVPRGIKRGTWPKRDADRSIRPTPLSSTPVVRTSA